MRRGQLRSISCLRKTYHKNPEIWGRGVGWMVERGGGMAGWLERGGGGGGGGGRSEEKKYLEWMDSVKVKPAVILSI